MTYISEHGVTNAEPELWQPYYGIGFGGAVKRYFKKYATFNGRASRSEFWWVVLFNAIVVVAFQILAHLTGGASVFGAEVWRGEFHKIHFSAAAGVVGFVSGVYALAIIIPSLALSWRRYHDSNHSGLWYLLNVIPFFGQLVNLVFVLLGPRPEGARFDRPPAGANYNIPGIQATP